MTATAIHDGIEASSNTDSEAQILEALGKTPEPPSQAQVAEPATQDAAAAGADGTDPEPDPASDAGKKLAARKKSLQERVDELTFNWRSEQREREKLQRELEAARAKKPAEEQATSQYLTGPPPTEDEIGTKFETYNDYLSARARWEAKEEIAQERQASTATAQQRAYHEAMHAVHTRGREKHATFDAEIEKFTQSGRQFTPAMTDAICFLPEGHDIAFTLMTDSKAYEQLAQAPNQRMFDLQLGRLLARLDAAPPPTSASSAKPVSQAPPPVTPVRTGPVTVSDEPPGDDAPVEAHVAYWDAKDREARKRR